MSENTFSALNVIQTGHIGVPQGIEWPISNYAYLHEKCTLCINDKILKQGNSVYLFLTHGNTQKVPFLV